MQYKTLVLQLLLQRPRMHENLRRRRALLPALDRYSLQLKTSHEAWKEKLTQAHPDSSEPQIASEALEIALQELQEALPFESPPDDSQALSLDAAMAFIKRMPQG